MVWSIGPWWSLGPHGSAALWQFKLFLAEMAGFFLGEIHIWAVQLSLKRSR